MGLARSPVSSAAELLRPQAPTRERPFFRTMVSLAPGPLIRRATVT